MERGVAIPEARRADAVSLRIQCRKNAHNASNRGVATPALFADTTVLRTSFSISSGWPRSKSINVEALYAPISRVGRFVFRRAIQHAKPLRVGGSDDFVHEFATVFPARIAEENVRCQNCACTSGFRLRTVNAS